MFLTATAVSARFHRHIVRSRLLLLWLSIAGPTLGCASSADQGASKQPAPSDAPATGLSAAAESAILAVAGRHATGTKLSLPGGGSATFDSAYDAASGRMCRSVRIDGAGGGGNRLACAPTRSAEWTFAALIFPVASAEAGK